MVRTAAQELERTRLLLMTEAQAMAEGAPTWYQQMRYLREMEAANFVNNVQREAAMKSNQPKKEYRRSNDD